jgi:ParB/RepB/Spo0J family partition protein
MKVAWVGIDEIDDIPEELNSRRTYDDNSINELAASIQEHGILQPLCVRPAGTRYILVFGMRRFRAASRAGLKEVPCSIQLADDERAFLLNTIENLHRHQLTGAERVRAIEKLAATNLGVREISRRTGFAHTTISRWLRIDRRPALKQAVEAEQLDIGRAMVLATAPEDSLAGLLETAAMTPQQELWRQVGTLKVVHYAPGRSVDSRRLLQALRLLSLVRELDPDDMGLLDQINARVEELRGPRRARTK